MSYVLVGNEWNIRNDNGSFLNANYLEEFSMTPAIGIKCQSNFFEKRQSR